MDGGVVRRAPACRCVDREGELIMRRTARALFMAGVLVLTLGVAAPAQAGKAHPVPIKGTVSGEHWIDLAAPDCDEGALWRFGSSGTGNMSHLGKVDYVLTQCSFPDGFRDGTITFAAANRDTLVIAQEGTFEVVGNLEGFTGEGTWTVVDGTGRFAQATGSGSLDFIGDIPGGGTVLGLPDGINEWSFAGEVSYDASNRAAK